MSRENMNTPQEDELTSKCLFCESLFWIAVLVATSISICVMVSLIMVDFVHGNPNRSESNAGLIIFLFPVIIFIVAPIAIFIVFSVSQIIQGLAMRALYPTLGRYAYILVGLTVPLISIVTWYCYDYLTPTDFNLGINEGAYWQPYQHGMNSSRYLAAFVGQASVTIFSLLYFESTLRGRSRKTVILVGLLLATVIGVFLGVRQAISQYQFIDSSLH